MSKASEIMKNIIGIIFMFITSCATPKLEIKPVCDEQKMEQWFSLCMSDKDTIGSNTAKVHYTSYCRSEARRLFCHLDSIIVKGKKTYNYNNAPERIKDQITNIIR